ncbi:SDR family NAD(P)-dependent oxidoreductase [Streptomyces noursei]|uniref:SDR family NAD(P)-dependent oxidoreductase n=1 Tax=Streptomyces noursei TaxID=1971 RepID=UPI001674374F|nr:SDR family oxidoreductase [Streptomyces noursei]MCZ1018713.1 SDR family NAD(P)-dependent oxidoreductase [Streptomyces noursei]GGX26781.1 ketoreductase [Streptomyces noursei]
MPLTLSGKTAIVTGAGSGIGRATTLAFADRGANVLAVGRSPEKLAATAEGHPTIVPLAADVTDQASPAAVVEAALDAFGGINALVHGAGTLKHTPLGGISADDFDRCMAVNLRAPLLLTQAALPPLTRSGGTVINISASTGQRGWPGMSLYGASKAGLDFLTRTWAGELADRGIRVVSVAPGPIETPILDNNALDDHAVSAVHRLQELLPLSRLGSAQEVAWWIVNFAESLATYTTGVILPIDGGYGAV